MFSLDVKNPRFTFMPKPPKPAQTQLTITCRSCGGAGHVRKGSKTARCSSCAAILTVAGHSVTVHGIDAAEVEKVSRALLADVHASRPRPSPWLSGCFYLLSAMVVVAILLVAARLLPVLVLPCVFIGSVILLEVIGAFQLRHDDRLNEKSFLSLMALSFRALPWIRGRSAIEPTKSTRPPNV